MAKLPNIHPGEILMEEFLIPLEISAYKLAKDLDIPQTRISQILKGKRRITADTALRLSRYFGNSPKFWLGLQNDYDIEEEKHESIEITTEQKAALATIIEELEAAEDDDAYQASIFNASKAHGVKARELFPIVYQILLGQPRGPRFGPYVGLVGKESVISDLKKAIQ